VCNFTKEDLLWKIEVYDSINKRSYKDNIKQHFIGVSTGNITPGNLKLNHCLHKHPDIVF